VAGLIFAVSTAGAGPKLEVGEDAWLQPAFLGQVHYSFRDDAADDEDFYLRRGRIILKGQIMDGVKFFVETDNDNAGKNGASSASTDIQDAWVDVRLVGTEDCELWAQGGLILLPFSLENRASAASLLGIDYNAEAIKLVNAFVWRDYGVELHGRYTDRLAFRGGVFDGYDQYATSAVEKNDSAALRYTAHVELNVVGDVEKGGWFYAQNRLGKSEYLVVGAGIDSQDDATRTIVDPDDPEAVSLEQDSDAWVVDFQSSLNLGEKAALLVNGAYYDWDNAAFDGNTAFVEGGLLCREANVMITGKYSLTDPSGGDETTDYTAGLNYFMKGHNARGAIEYRWGDSDDWTLVGLQFLL
jgi:hypothetical protein